MSALPLYPPLEDSLVPFCRAPQQFLLERARLHGALARYRLGAESFASVSDPELAHAVLHGSVADFEKGPLYDVVRATFGDGLFTAESEHWKVQHAVIAPLFAGNRVRRLQSLVADVTTRQIECWRGRGDHADGDVMVAMKRVAFDVVSIGVLGLADGRQRDALFDEMHRIDLLPHIAIRYLGQRLPVDRLSGIMDRGDSSVAAALVRMNDLLYAIADQRLANRGDGDDVVGTLVSSELMSDLTPEHRRELVRDTIGSMLTAGYVSTGESLFWALYQLGRHPDAQARVRAEVRTTGDQLADAPPYLAAVINESLRLYPPAWYIGRTTRRPLQLGGVDLPAGTQVVCSPFVLHRMPALWPDPVRFSPERFLPGAPIVPRSFIPFGSGPRACLGRALALMEMRSLISATVTSLEIEVESHEPVTLTASYSMQPRERVRFRLHPR